MRVCEAQNFCKQRILVNNAARQHCVYSKQVLKSRIVLTSNKIADAYRQSKHFDDVRR